MKINFIDIRRQYDQYRQEIDAQIHSVLNEASFIMGQQVGELEAQLAAYAGSKHAIACASGTDALQLVLMAYGVKPGDEIITTPFTFIATAEMISLLGAKPVFVDIRSDTLNIDPQEIKEAITPRTRGIIAVDIFGQCADYEEINRVAKEHGLFVIEDAAQSFGARYKGRPACSLADAGCTSFFPSKPLGCYGDGGMMFTDDADVAMVLRSLRGHGAGSHKYEHVRIGVNSRLDTLQAGVLLAKFKHFPKEIELRNEAADYYTRHLKDIAETPVILPFNSSVHAQYSIRVKDRETLQKRLQEDQVPTAVHYPRPLHLQPAYADLGYQAGDLPVTEDVCKHIVALPMHPFLYREEQDFIIAKVKKHINER